MLQVRQQGIDVDVIDVDRAGRIRVHVTDLREILKERIVPIALGENTFQVQAEHVALNVHVNGIQRYTAVFRLQKVMLGDIEGEQLPVDGLGQSREEREDDGREGVQHGDVVRVEIEKFREILKTVAKIGVETMAIDMLGHVARR